MLGDWFADSGLGFGSGATEFGAGLLILAALYYWTTASRAGSAFPNNPFPKSRLDFGRPVATLVLAVAIVLLIVLFSQRAGNHPGASDGAAV